MKKLQQGFTLIELMIVVAIIGILASIAVPQYQNFILKADFKEVVTATSAYKLGVEFCAQEHSNNPLHADCDNGWTGRLGNIPAAITALNAYGVVALVATANGVITATSTLADGAGVASATYIITPASSPAGINWTVSGTCSSASPAIC